MGKLPMARVLLAVAVCGSLGAMSAEATATALPPVPSRPSGHTPGIEQLDHLIFIVQENRSFDHYFGTYSSPSGEPVNGIPRTPDGRFKPCIPHPVLGRCVRPFKTNNHVNFGGPHGHPHSVISVNRGRMNGFIKAAYQSPNSGGYRCVAEPRAKRCRRFNGPQLQPDLMSTLGRNVIPNYWAYADYGVLQDRLFAPTDSWSLPAHLYLYSAWSAVCPGGPMSCRTNITHHEPGPYKWTDITYLLDEAGVSWKTYVGEETVVTCPKWPCRQTDRRNSTPWHWNVLPGFQTVRKNRRLDRIQPISSFFTDIQNETLPSVSWILPPSKASEHPSKGSLRPGHAHVTRIVNALATSPLWYSSAIFITWDDWGGFYDHVRPPRVDAGGYGIRVPGLMISPYAKQAYVDHQTLSFDAYLKLIEDRFLGGARLDPDTMSRPDGRNVVRESLPILGDLRNEFDFTQAPRDPAPIILDPKP